ncbi:MAG: anti-sigma factor antagonist [Spirochaetes bacterium]|nr:MAG: anti-sigma factor antagonist [Spirochaetota bacterium]
MLFIHHTEISGGKIVIIEVKGGLDSVTSPDFEGYIDRLMEKGKYFIILDGLNLNYVSSEGIGVMLYIQKKIAAQNGFFIVCGLSSEIMTLYRLLGFERVIMLTFTRDEAVQTMEKQLEMRGIPEKGSARERRPVAVPTAAARATAPEARREAHAEAGRPDTLPADGSEGAEVDFDNPLIVECTECKGLIRVRRSGGYQCPYCTTLFTVERDQTVIF